MTTTTIQPEITKQRYYLITNHGTANIFEHLYNHNLMLKVLYYLTAEDIKEVEVKTANLDDRLEMWKYINLIYTYNKIISNYKKHIKETKIYLGYKTLHRLNLYFNPVRPFRNSDAVIKFLTNNPKVSDYNYELRKKRTTHLANKGMYYSFIKTIAEYRSKFIIEINDISDVFILNPLLQRSIGYIENSINIDNCLKFNRLYELLESGIPHTFFKQVRISQTISYIIRPLSHLKIQTTSETIVSKLNKLLQYDNINLSICNPGEYNTLIYIDDNYPVEKPILVKQGLTDYKPVEKYNNDEIDIENLKKVIEAINKFNFEFGNNSDNSIIIRLSQNQLTDEVNDCIGLIEKPCVIKYEDQAKFEALSTHYEHIEYRRIFNRTRSIHISNNGDLHTNMYIRVTLPDLTS
jgi:hypothetical protein